MTLWQGRFGNSAPSDDMTAFTNSLAFDQKLAGYDLANSRAHVKGLAQARIISVEERDTILAALSAVEKEFSSGKFVFAEGDEDIHTAVERRVTELAGPAGAKLHSGRSRNDQVVTDTRLFTKAAITEIIHRLFDLQETLLSRAIDAGETYLPGYTHLQRAQPVYLSHHLLAHAWSLVRDVDRMIDALKRVDVSTLGAGAAGGSSLPLEPEFVAEQLGFASSFDNSLDAVSDRDFVAEFLFDLSLVAVHLSRLGEETVLWTSEEFGFATLDDAYATGSSMLPQKKNPDAAELARGKAGRLIGNLTGFLATLKGLPLAFNRDLQEDKEPLFDSVEQTRLALIAVNGMYKTMVFHADRMKKAADAPATAAVDLAEYLVESGTPFREAHHIIGDMVRQAGERHVPLAELVEAHPLLGKDALSIFEPGASVARRRSPGGSGAESVQTQLTALKARLAEDRRRLSGVVA